MESLYYREGLIDPVYTMESIYYREDLYYGESIEMVYRPGLKMPLFK